MTERKGLPPFDPEREKALLMALAKGDLEFFRQLGGLLNSAGKSAREVMALRAEAERRGLLAPEKVKEAMSDQNVLADFQRQLMEIENYFAKKEKEPGYYMNVGRNTTTAIFYRLLAEEFPELGMTVQEKAVNNEESPNALSENESPDDFIAIFKTKKYKDSWQFIGEKLVRHPVTALLRIPSWEIWYNGPEDLSDKIARAEQSGLLNQNQIERVVKRSLRDEFEYLNQRLAEELAKDSLRHPENSQELQSRLEQVKQRLVDYQDAEPLTDEEIKGLLRSVIKSELKKRNV